MIKKISLLALMILGLFQIGNTQKFGHINSTQLLLELPSVKTADQQLETFQKQLVTKGQQMVEQFQKDYQAYTTKVDARTLSQLQMQEEEAKLGATQQKIQTYEQEVQQKLVAKRETLYQPILTDLKVKLDEIGKEGNYTMIFDSSAGGLLHANDSEDLMAKMKVKLGL